MIAESGLNAHAERWGTRTQEAREVIDNGETFALADIIYDTWPDISFSYMQQIVLYHYLGDHSPTINNCLLVREETFSDPEANIRDGAKRLRSCTDRSPEEDKTFLAAMSIYNTGSYKVNWSNASNYRNALIRAKAYVI